MLPRFKLEYCYQRVHIGENKKKKKNKKEKKEEKKETRVARPISSKLRLFVPSII